MKNLDILEAIYETFECSMNLHLKTVFRDLHQLITNLHVKFELFDLNLS